MHMTVDDCIKFANQNPSSYIATTEGDQPRVRPKVELCFFDAKSKGMDQMRVTGQVDFIEDMKTREKLIEARPFLKEMGFSADSPKLIVFRIVKCTAHFWTWETNLKPKEYISFG
jgi:pyridoxamine 5'-phosphate oxidase